MLSVVSLTDQSWAPFSFISMFYHSEILQINIYPYADDTPPYIPESPESFTPINTVVKFIHNMDGSKPCTAQRLKGTLLKEDIQNYIKIAFSFRCFWRFTSYYLIKKKLHTQPLNGK